MPTHKAGNQLYIPNQPTEGFLREKASKFYAYSWPVNSQDDIDVYLKSLKKKYYDARHHCYAWRLGEEGEMMFANDAGEPAHTAGTPILAAIKSAELTQILVAVVRYFGGTKLGKRGLIDAYRHSATIALEKINRIPIIPSVSFKLFYSYDQTTEVQKILHQFETEMINASYTDTCMQHLKVEKDEFARLKQLFLQINIPIKSE